MFATKNSVEEIPYVLMVPIEKLIPTPDNRRKPISDNSVGSLAQSIKNEGILQPLLVRAHPTKDNLFEIRAGERRWRAAKLAGLKVVPVIVRKLEDGEALSVTIVENLQREDLHPLEEAESIQQAFDRGVDTKTLAARLGKPVRHIVRRASLAKLSSTWRRAIRKPNSDASRLSAAHLEIIARLPASTQESLAEDDGYAVLGRGFPTVEELRRTIDATLQTLGAMPWALDDETLDPKVGSCLNCEKRSSKQAVLFPEVEGAKDGKSEKHDRCLDPACFGRKQVAHLRLCEAKLRTTHNELRLVQLGIGNLSDAVHEVFGERIARVYYPKLAKRGAKNALPVMQVDGPKAGKLIFLESESEPAIGRAARKRDAAGKPIPLTLAERQERLQRRRYAYVVRKVEETLRSFDGNSVPRVEEADFDPVALLAAFGNGRVADRTSDEAWDEYDRLRFRESKIRSLVSIETVVPIWARRLVIRDRDQVGTQAKEAKRMCALLGADYAAFEREALEAIPEPKSWAQLETGETPKLPATKPLQKDKHKKAA